MNENIESLKKSIDHWNVMLEWAKRQPERGRADIDLMESAIHEGWWGDYCPCCFLAEKRKKDGNDDLCPHCPIVIAGFKPCDDFESSWSFVRRSFDWAEWIPSAEAMISTLQKALEYHEQQERTNR